MMRIDSPGVETQTWYASADVEGVVVLELMAKRRKMVYTATVGVLFSVWLLC